MNDDKLYREFVNARRAHRIAYSRHDNELIANMRSIRNTYATAEPDGATQLRMNAEIMGAYVIWQQQLEAADTKRDCRMAFLRKQATPQQLERFGESFPATAPIGY